jgi:anti-anti-sigma factor
VSGSDGPSGRIDDCGDLEILRLDSSIALLVPRSALDGEQLEGTLRRGIAALVADGVTGLVLDLRAFSVLDSSGLGALVATHGELADLNGVRLVLTGVGPSLRRTLSRVMLLQVFPVYESVERAFASLRS